MAELGKLLVILGALLLVGGALLMLSAHLRWPLGRLPGDITYHGRHVVVFLPITSCILLSVILSLLLYLVSRLHR